jgi:hypothetical protein
MTLTVEYGVHPQDEGVCRSCRMRVGDTWREVMDRTLIVLKDEMKGQRECLQNILIALTNKKEFPDEDRRNLQGPAYQEEAVKWRLHGNIKRIGIARGPD